MTDHGTLMNDRASAGAHMVTMRERLQNAKQNKGTLRSHSSPETKEEFAIRLRQFKNELTWAEMDYSIALGKEDLPITSSNKLIITIDDGKECYCQFCCTRREKENSK